MTILQTELEKEILSKFKYHPKAGILEWVKPPRTMPYLQGTQAGAQDNLGYWRIQLKHKGVYVHRIAFLFMTGALPILDIDHIDRNPANNKWNNLREVTKKQNMGNLNVYSNSPFGIAGVSCRKERDKFKACIILEKQDGTRLQKSEQADTLEEAIDAKRKLVDKYCPELASEWKSRRILPYSM